MRMHCNRAFQTFATTNCQCDMLPLRLLNKCAVCPIPGDKRNSINPVVIEACSDIIKLNLFGGGAHWAHVGVSSIPHHAKWEKRSRSTTYQLSKVHSPVDWSGAHNKNLSVISIAVHTKQKQLHPHTPVEYVWNISRKIGINLEVIVRLEMEGEINYWLIYRLIDFFSSPIRYFNGTLFCRC